MERQICEQGEEVGARALAGRAGGSSATASQSQAAAADQKSSERDMIAHDDERRFARNAAPRPAQGILGTHTADAEPSMQAKTLPQEPDPVTSIERQNEAAVEQLPQLRACELQFFNLELKELAESSAREIGRDQSHGDAFAYLCFALLAEGHAQDPPQYDLVELLRNYFSACERPMGTEGGAVCRLILKLVFGDLVKRIAKAQPGDKFSLRVEDPLCGGAFAVLDGELERARECFVRASADSGSRVYGLAGMALLKALDGDDNGALAILADAGGEDEDIREVAAELRRG
jgi:hypothetical protein